jgi:hypothetical protein
MDITVVGAAVSLTLGVCADARIVMGGSHRNSVGSPLMMVDT